MDDADPPTEDAAVPLAPEVQHPLQQINKNVALKEKLQQWEKEEDIARKRVENKETRRSSTQNEIYQLFGLYFVFQGVVLSALYQAAAGSSSRALCKSWWLPFTLSLITSVATITATLHKLHDHGKIEYGLELEKLRTEAIFNFIEAMRHSGDKFDMDSGPQITANTPVKPSFFNCIFHRSLRAYTVSVTLVLTVFSMFLLAACKILLCHG